MAAIPFDLRGQPLAVVLADPSGRDQLESALPAFLAGQRWFAGKERGIVGAAIEHAVPLDPGGDLVDLVVIVTDNEGATARYQVPLAAAGGELHDALLPAHATHIRDILLGPPPPPSPIARFVPRVLATGQPCAGAARQLNVEQSNSSVVFGEACILKVFRTLQDGLNPDVELTAWLSGPGGFSNVPRVIAAARVDAPGLDADAAVLQEFVPNDGDGWQWFLSHARAAVVATTADELHAFLASERETLAAATELGRATASLHAALSRAGSPGLQPEPATPVDWAQWGADLRNEAARTADLLRPTDRPLAKKLSTFAATPVPAAPGALGLKTRVHGDYHLGQLLHAPRGWVIVDFEGEPARPLSERNALQHPLVDVAGLLRSFDYAAHVADLPPTTAAAWTSAVSDACLAAYLDEASRAAPAFLPEASGVRDALLRAFILRKALYEVRYELGSRPDWVSIPGAAVAAMLEPTQ